MMRKVRIGIKTLRRLLLAFALAIAVVPSAAFAAEVAVTVEKLTVDGGFIVEPTLVPISGTSAASDVLLDLLDATFPGVTPYSYNGRESDFYIQGIYDPARGRLIMEQDEEFGNLSGWMITVNNNFLGVSAGVRNLSSGDVVRWQYTKELGADLGGGTSAGPSALANKDALIRRVAEINKAGNKNDYSAYAQAMNVLRDLGSAQNEVNSAVAALISSAPDDPDTPGEPDTPDTPDTPGEPNTPDTPDNPGEPNTPSTPDNPNSDTPSAPSGGEAAPVKPNLPNAPSEIKSVAPDIVSDKKQFGKAALPENWMTQGKGGYVLNGAQAKEEAKRLWSDVTATESLPVFSASADGVGGIVAVGFDVKGATLLAARTDGVKVMKVLPDGEPLQYIYDESGYGDGSFRVLRGGELYRGAISSTEDYTLVLFIKDGGHYDLDPDDGAVLDPAVIVSAKDKDSESNNQNDGGSGGGGCSAGAGFFGAFALFAAVRIASLAGGFGRKIFQKEMNEHDV